MSKKKNRRVVVTSKKKPERVEPAGSRWVRWVSLNIFGVVLVLLVLNFVLRPTSYYGWVFDKLLLGNMEFIREHSELSLSDRYASKLGSGYTYVLGIRNQTPDSAVILYPSRSEFFPAGEESSFPPQADVSNKMWALRFLYPRRLVLVSELDSCYLRDSITHVAIVNGRGFERLPYRVSGGMRYGVLPLDPSSLNRKEE
jgi:hypothetical protein